MPAASDPLAHAFANTAYTVRLRTGGRAALHVGAPPPASLLALIGAAPWAFVTAWNPQALAVPRADNRAAQRRLIGDLRRLPGVDRMRPGVGIGRDGWRESSLFVVGVRPSQVEPLLRSYRQRAYLAGVGASPARLRWL